MDTKKKSVIMENIAIAYILLSFIAIVVTITCCLVKNKDLVNDCIKQAKSEMNSFVISVKNETSAFGTNYYEIARNISEMGEDERVLYALRSGETWFLNERETALYKVIYSFSAEHTYSKDFDIIKDAHDLVCESAS